MNKANKFSPEVRERAVRMVLEHRGEHPSLWAATQSISPRRHTAVTLRASAIRHLSVDVRSAIPS